MSKIVFICCLFFLISCSKTSEIKNVDIAMCAFLQEEIVDENDLVNDCFNRLKEKLITSDISSNPNQYKRIQSVFGAFQEIDKQSNKRIIELDQLKINIFKNLKLQVKPDKLSACTEYDFSQVNLNSSTSDVEEFKRNKDVFFKENLKFFNQIIQIYLENHPRSDKPIHFKEISIEEFSNYSELNELVSKEIDQMNVPNDLKDVLMFYYTQVLISKKQFDDNIESIDNWTSLFNFISTFQVKILKAKKMLFLELNSNFGGCDINFDKIEIVVSGPEKVRVGEEFKLDVFNAAVNTEDQPVIKTTGSVSIKDGIATVVNKFNQKGTQIISGTISYRTKSGEIKTKSWSKKIIVD